MSRKGKCGFVKALGIVLAIAGAVALAIKVYDWFFKGKKKKAAKAEKAEEAPAEGENNEMTEEAPAGEAGENASGTTFEASAEAVLTEAEGTGEAEQN